MMAFLNRRVVLVSVAILTSVMTVACSTSITASADTRVADTAQLTRQAEAWDAAIVRKDEVAIAGNMADDFRQIDGDGDLETKASFIAGIVSPKLNIDPYIVEDFEVRLYGDVALLSGRTRMTGQYDGKPFTSHYRYIDVYVRQAGSWKITSVQISRLAK